MRKIVIGVSGASGMALTRRFMEILAVTPGLEVSCVVSEGARRVLAQETGEDETLFWALAKHAWQPNDLSAPPAGGSWWTKEAAMVVIPCSMGTLGAIASGYCANLLHRAADAALKEKRPLILVTRESPVSQIHLRNMLTLSQAGAVIMPFSPGFYFKPRTIGDLLGQFCWRIMDQLDIPHNGPRWGTK